MPRKILVPFKRSHTDTQQELNDYKRGTDTSNNIYISMYNSANINYVNDTSGKW